jgi:predicted transcriptional regulator of viral defense system
MNRAQLKELVKNIMSEESEYQAFFQKALEKAGKSIPSMSDDEKKAFFNKIDSAWDGKGEKNEGNAFGAAVTAAKKAGEDKFKVGGETYKVEEKLVGGQKKLDVDGDGEIEASDLADLRAGKKANEGMELPKATIPSAVKSKLEMAIDKIKDSNLTYNQKIQVVGQVMDSLGLDKAEFNKMASKLKGTMESIKEGVSSTDMDKIKGAVEAANSFMSVGSELKKLGMKYTFATEPLPIYIIQPTPNNKVAIVNKKYATKPDFVVGDIAVGIMESKSSKSVNEGRAFINAARKAKTEGLTEFEFNGKKYPVTIKD